MRLLVVLSCVAAVALAEPGYSHGPDVHYPQPYHGPLAPLAHDGRVVDTPEVAHAKEAHYHAYHAELAKASPYHGPSYEEHHAPHAGPVHHDVDVHALPHHVPAHVDYHHPEPVHNAYHGPPAPLGHDGRVIDTPEVEHAKAAHFHAYAEELSKVAHKGPVHHVDYHHPSY